MCLDIYLSGLSKFQLEKIHKHLKPSKRLVPPLLCGDIWYPQVSNSFLYCKGLTPFSFLN